MSATKRWTIVLGASGEILGGDGLPAAWIGATLADLEEAPAVLRAAARSMGAGSRGFDVDELDAHVELIVVGALAIRRRLTDVRALLEEATAALRRQAVARDVDLGVAADDAVPPTALLDPEKIAWVVTALVGNAMRYVRQGTRQKPGGTITVRALVDDRADLVIAVNDDGPGIPAEVQARLFPIQGAGSLAAGLALSVARDIVAAHAGRLEVGSTTDEIDHGTTVTIFLPLR